MKKIHNLVVFAIVLFSSNAYALLEIEITQGVESAMPVAITPVAGDMPIEATLLESVVFSDLHRSGYFSIIDKKNYPQQSVNLDNVDYPKWRNVGIEALLTMKATAAGEGKVRVQFELYDLVRKNRILGHSVTTNKNQLRKVAHKISDLVFEKLTGIKGAFSTRVAYISEASSSKGKKYQLQIADADGYNPRTVFSSSKQLLSPAWAPDGRRLAYVSFENDRTEIFMQDITTGKRTKISSEPGINSAPAWSPDGSSIALTLSSGGDPDIYILDVESRKLRKLTNHYGIDTEAVWSPDGRFIYFTSNRSGAPQIYRVSFGGGSPKRMTFEGNYNAAASVSADGKRIAMVHRNDGGYRIGLLEIETNSFRLLTDGTLDEAPSFAPNGSMIIYSTRHNNSTVLSAVSADGRVRQRLRLQKEKVREPSWSPFRR
ncbi:MAG: Tol-Pal system beta propeller repeat protein TolB [Gammaproteobacteria bacterium]